VEGVLAMKCPSTQRLYKKKGGQKWDGTGSEENKRKGKESVQKFFRYKGTPRISGRGGDTTFSGGKKSRKAYVLTNS